jgi:hypothetical protein
MNCNVVRSLADPISRINADFIVVFAALNRGQVFSVLEQVKSKLSHTRPRDGTCVTTRASRAPRDQPINLTNPPAAAWSTTRIYSVATLDATTSTGT